MLAYVWDYARSFQFMIIKRVLLSEFHTVMVFVIIIGVRAISTMAIFALKPELFSEFLAFGSV